MEIFSTIRLHFAIPLSRYISGTGIKMQPSAKISCPRINLTGPLVPVRFLLKFFTHNMLIFFPFPSIKNLIVAFFLLMFFFPE